jgi:acyl carrier protein
MKKIIAAVNQLLEQEFEIDPALLKPEALLKEDLDLDSLDAVDMIVAIDHEFGIRIQEEEAKNLRVLKDIYDIIHNLATAGAGEADR